MHKIETGRAGHSSSEARHVLSAMCCAIVLMFAAACSGGGDGNSGGGNTNQAPTANAGPDQALAEGTQVQLDGSGSSDPDSDVLVHQWTQTTGPAVTLSNPNAVAPTFAAPGGMSIDQMLVFSLVVNDGKFNSAADAVTVTVQPAPPAAANGFVTRTVAALAKGRFTLNNPWTRADLQFENIDPDKLAYQSITGVDQWVRPYTTMITEYEARRRQCEQDYHTLYAREQFDGLLRTYHFTDRKCYPTLQLAHGLEESTFGDEVAQQALQRYGYYCGGGFPNFGAFAADAPEPLDSVDYCCRLHDDQAWGGKGIMNLGSDVSNECGIAMCLRKATANRLAVLPPNVEESRQHWYGHGVAGGASFVCPGNQSNSALAPVGE